MHGGHAWASSLTCNLYYSIVDMKQLTYNIFFWSVILYSVGCADNTLSENPEDENFPFQLVLDTDEGEDLPDAEDYSVEIKFADYLPEQDFPGTTVILQYAITDLEEDMAGNVAIDEVVYEVELSDCVYTRNLTFTTNGDGTGTITLAVDDDLGTVPEAFEVVFSLPGTDDTAGSFVFAIESIETEANLILGYPRTFAYEVLDNEVAGEWILTIADEATWENFKSVWGTVSPDLDAVAWADITGEVAVEFEFEEMKIVVALNETETETTCEDGEEETEENHIEIEIEADYDAEDGALELEGSYEVIGDDGEVADELDFITTASYGLAGDQLTITFTSVIDEDHYAAGDELYASTAGLSFVFVKD